MTKDTRFRPSGQAARDYASEYIARGWAPIPVPWRSKNPGYDGWQHLRVTADTLHQYFNGTRQNVGVLLGDPSGGLVDIDLDCPEALIAARHFLPDTGCVFGRAGNPSSHCKYLTTTSGGAYGELTNSPPTGLKPPAFQLVLVF